MNQLGDKDMNIMKDTMATIFNHGRSVILLLIYCIVIMNILPVPCFGIETGLSENVISITLANEPLNEVLLKISKATGYQIEITKDWENRILTVNLDKLTLEEGIKKIIRVLGNPNYTLVTDDSIKKVKIEIFETSFDQDPDTTSIIRRNRERRTEVMETDIDTDPVYEPEPPQVAEEEMQVKEEEKQRESELMEQEKENEEPPEPEIQPPD